MLDGQRARIQPSPCGAQFRGVNPPTHATLKDVSWCCVNPASGERSQASGFARGVRITGPFSGHHDITAR